MGYLDFGYRLKALAGAYDLTVVSRRPLTEPEIAVDARVAVYRPAARGTPALAWYWWQVARHLRTHRTDLVVHLCSHTAALANLSLGAPQVVYWNEHPGHYLGSTRLLRRWVGASMRALQYRGARRAALVMPIGEAHQDDLLAHGCRAAQLEVVPMGVADWFSAPGGGTPPPADPARPLRVVYAGGIHVDRGRDVMIDAVALARRAGVEVRLTLIGATAQQAAQCEARAAQQGVSAAVHVLARLPGEQIPQHLAQADFGICLWADKPHWRFNPPTKLFEYLVAGLPVLASNIRTHTAYLRDGSDGYVFEYSAESLAATFVRATAERARWPDMRRAVSARGRQYRWSEIEPAFLRSLGTLVRQEVRQPAPETLSVAVAAAAAVTMDVFDTALTRCWARPQHAFLACAERLRASGLWALTDESWMQLRQDAEASVLARSGADLATLEAIYAELARMRRWTPAETAAALAIEVAVECDGVRPVPRMLASCQQMARQERPLRFLSDMYLPEPVVAQLLGRVGWRVDADQVWVSAYRGASKSRGDLYGQAVAAWPGVAAQQVLHVGDHPINDVQRARQAGLRALHWEDTRLSAGAWSVLGVEAAPLRLRSLVAGAQRLALLQRPVGAALGAAHGADARACGLWSLGAGHAGPLLTLYVWWLLRDAAQRGLGRLYFLARDGQALLDVARVLQAAGVGRGIELRYLHASRQAWFAPSLTRWTEAAVFRVLDEPDRLSEPGKLARRLGFADAQALREQWPSLVSALTPHSSNREVAACLIRHVPGEQGLAHCAALRADAVDYLAGQGLFDGTAWAIVDLGWRGRLQECLGRIVATHPRGHELSATGYYLGLLEAPTGLPAGWQALAFSAQGTDPRLPGPAHLFELLCEADHGSTRGYARAADAQVQAVFDPRPDPAMTAWGLGTYRQAVVCYASQLAGSLPLLGETPVPPAALWAMAQALGREFFGRPDLPAAQTFARMPCSFTVNHDESRELAPEIGRADAWCRALSLGRLRLSATTTPWLPGSLARSSTVAFGAYARWHRLADRIRDHRARRAGR